MGRDVRVRSFWNVGEESWGSIYWSVQSIVLEYSSECTIVYSIEMPIPYACQYLMIYIKEEELFFLIDGPGRRERAPSIVGKIGSRSGEDKFYKR